MLSDSSQNLQFALDGVGIDTPLKRGFVLSGATIINLEVNGMSVRCNHNVKSSSLANHSILHISGNVISALRVGSGSVFSNHALTVDTTSGNVTQHLPTSSGTLSSALSSVDGFTPIPHVVVDCEVLVANFVSSNVSICGSVCDVEADDAIVSVTGTSSIIETGSAYVTLNTVSVVRSTSGNITLDRAKSAYSEYGIVNVDQVAVDVSLAEESRRKRKLESMQIHQQPSSSSSSSSSSFPTMSSQSFTSLLNHQQPSSSLLTSTPPPVQIHQPTNGRILVSVSQPDSRHSSSSSTQIPQVRAFSIFKDQASHQHFNRFRAYIRAARWGDIHGNGADVTDFLKSYRFTEIQNLKDLFGVAGEYLHIEYSTSDVLFFTESHNHKYQLLHTHQHGDPNYNTCINMKHNLSHPPNVFSSNYHLGGMHYLHQGLPGSRLTCAIYQGTHIHIDEFKVQFSTPASVPQCLPTQTRAFSIWSGNSKSVVVFRNIIKYACWGTINGTVGSDVTCWIREHLKSFDFSRFQDFKSIFSHIAGEFLYIEYEIDNGDVNFFATPRANIEFQRINTHHHVIDYQHGIDNKHAVAPSSANYAVGGVHFIFRGRPGNHFIDIYQGTVV